MKKSILYIRTFLSVAIFALSSCIKEKFTEERNGPDPSPWYSYTANWQETQKKVGNDGWQIITNGNRLNLWWDIDTVKARKMGAYKYKAAGLGINIDTTGYMQIKGQEISFMRAKDTVLDTIATAQYLISGDTSLVIRNTTSVPVIEMKYKKIN